MCMLIHKPADAKKPSEEIIKHCDSVNPHGIGIAVNNGNMFTVKKDFIDVKSFLEYYKTLKDNKEMVIHFRFATHGSREFGNRHPFKVSNSKDELMQANFTAKEIFAHNGVIREAMELNKDEEDLSDTQIFIQKCFTRLKTPLLSGDVLVNSLIEKYISGSRLLYVSVDGKLWKKGYWYTHDGCSFSNNNYEPPKPVVYTPNTVYGFNKSIHTTGSLDWYWQRYQDKISNTTSGKISRKQNKHKYTCTLCGEPTQKLHYYEGAYMCTRCKDFYNVDIPKSFDEQIELDIQKYEW
jgi:ribosomal protein L37AE/L43A